MTNKEYQSARRIEAVQIASRVLSGKLGIIDGVHQLMALQDVIEGAIGEDFLVLKGIESETDEFPIGAERQNWDREALDAKDAELKTFADSIREDVLGVCGRLIEKLGG